MVVWGGGRGGEVVVGRGREKRGGRGELRGLFGWGVAVGGLVGLVRGRIGECVGETCVERTDTFRMWWAENMLRL